MTSVKENIDELNPDNPVEAVLTPKPYQGKDQREARKEEPEPEGEEPIPANEDVPDDELNAEELTFKKRYGDLRRHNQEEVSGLKDQINVLREQAKKATPNWTPPKTDEELETFANENPEAYDLLVSIADKQMRTSTKDLDNLRQQLEDSQRQTAEEKAKSVITANHPDWDEIRVGDDIHEWLEIQPKAIQDGVYANATDGELASRIIDLYKTDRGIGSQKDAKKSSAKAIKEAAATLVDVKDTATDKAKAKKTFTRSQIASMNIHEYEKNEDEILAAQREGRIENK